MKSQWQVLLDLKFYEIQENDRAHCILCRAKNKTSSVDCKRGSATSMIRHLATFHKTESREFENKMKGIQQQIENTKKLKQKSITDIYDQNRQLVTAAASSSSATETESNTKTTFTNLPSCSRSLDQLILHMVAQNNLPFNFVNSKSFRDLLSHCHSMKKPLNIKDESYYRCTMLARVYRSVKSEVVRLIHDSLALSITSDGWKMAVGFRRDFMSLTANVITKNWTRICLFLTMKELNDRHTSEYLLVVLREMMAEFNIEKTKVYGFSHDGAANEQKLGRLSGYESVWCAAHQLNLAVKSALECQEMVRRSITRIHNMVNIVKNSGVLGSRLRDIQLQQNPDRAPVVLKQDVSTRWHSTQHMVERVIELREVITQLIFEHTELLGACELSADRWKMLINSVRMLRLIEIMSDECCRQDECISCVLPMYVLTRKKITEIDCASIGTMQGTLLTELDNRFGPLFDSSMYVSAVFLDPRYKLSSVIFANTRQADLEAKVHRYLYEILCSQADSDTETEINENTSVDVDVDISEPSTSSAAQDDVIIEEHTNKYQKPTRDTLFSGIVFGEPATERFENTIPDLASSLTNEMITYRGEAHALQSSDPLAWWAANYQRYSLLSKCAARVLSLPATSVHSEQVFSTAGQILSESRARLGSERADQLMFLKRVLPSIRAYPLLQ